MYPRSGETGCPRMAVVGRYRGFEGRGTPWRDRDEIEHAAGTTGNNGGERSWEDTMEKPRRIRSCVAARIQGADGRFPVGGATWE